MSMPDILQTTPAGTYRKPDAISLNPVVRVREAIVCPFSFNCREKPIEKIILRILCPCTFSHNLVKGRPSGISGFGAQSGRSA
jgi:hypothetical protein